MKSTPGHALASSPRLGRKIAKLSLGKEAGKALATPRDIGVSHHTWWQAAEFDPIASTFIVTDL